MICGRKRGMAHVLAAILKQRVLPDNVVPQIFPQIFLGADTKICGKNVFGKSRHIMRQQWHAHAGKTMTFACVFAWLLPHSQYS